MAFEAQSITGSLFGTASWAVSSSYALTASYILLQTSSVSDEAYAEGYLAGNILASTQPANLTSAFTLRKNIGNIVVGDKIYLSNVGTYLVTFQAFGTSNGSGMTPAIYRSDLNSYLLGDNNANGGPRNNVTTTIYNNTSGSYLQLVVFNMSGNSIGGNSAGDATYFSVKYLPQVQKIQLTPSVDYSTPVPITLTATTTAPTKSPSRTTDYVRWRYVGGKEVQVEYKYVQVGATGASAGNGDYLFSLPAGFQFDPTLYPKYTGTLAASISTAIVPNGNASILAFGVNDAIAYVIPYDATRFRLWVYLDISGGRVFVNSGNYRLTDTNIAYYISFQFTSL